jgi:hypothetical protein
MKIARLLFFALLATLSLLSCQKEISNNPTDPNNQATVTGNMKAKIDGKQWVADKAAGASRMTGLINITGYSFDRKIITITMKDSGIHRYVLADVTINAAALIDSTDPNPFSFTSNQGSYPATAGGEVNLTAIDTAKKTMSGTFAFKVFRDADGKGKSISEGSFTNIPYSTTLPPSSATDSFQVKIDGASWVPQSVMGFSVPMMNQIAINATNATGSKTVGLTFPSNITPGTYTLDFWGLTYIGQYNPDTDPMHSKASMSGTLTILEHNTSTKRIRGNFNFRAEELLNSANFATISDGYFSVKYN